MFGDFTALIGDPTGRESERRVLSKEEVAENLRLWKKQISPILSFTDKHNPAQIMKNSAWLAKLSFSDVLRLASSFTVQHMIERDMCEKRIQKGSPVYLHEFLYPLMQGYDSVAMDVDVEIGGSDQIFNMLAGRILQRKYNNKEKFVIATALLENKKTGRKLMSKSEGNFVGLSDQPALMYGKIMALPDSTIIQVFTDCTLVLREDIERISREISEGKNPRDIKMELAREIVSLYHGKNKALAAEKQFVETFQKKEFPNDALAISVAKGAVLQEVLVKAGVVSSNSEFRRLLAAGAVLNVANGAKINDPQFKIIEPLNIKIGKRKFLKIEISSS